MGKIILFYKYIDIQYPKQIQKWQEQLCKQLQLKGRIIIAKEGINGTLGGETSNIDFYKNEMSKNVLFNDIDFKESEGNSDCFPRLRIVVRNEIVTLGIPGEIIDPKKASKHLMPSEFHDIISKKKDDLIIFDARNKYESDVGHFENAILPNIRFFRELPKYLDLNLDQFKDKTVLMYCTGGVRCERASAYLKLKNVAKEIYQLEGGIHKYIEQYPNGFFKGKNYVFDARVKVKANNDVIGCCYICKIKYDDYTNCLNAECNRHYIACLPCLEKLANTCSLNCFNLVNEQKVNIRPKFKKIETKSCSI